AHRGPGDRLSAASGRGQDRAGRAGAHRLHHRRRGTDCAVGSSVLFRRRRLGARLFLSEHQPAPAQQPTARRPVAVRNLRRGATRYWREVAGRGLRRRRRRRLPGNAQPQQHAIRRRRRRPLQAAFRPRPRRHRLPAEQARGRLRVPALSQHRPGVLTDTPPPHETGADVADTPAKKAKRKRTRLQLAAFIAGSTFAGLLALIVVALVGGRMYLVSDAGRELITSFVAGKKISRYGRINVEGLQGDLFNDFRLKRVTVTDEKGVWLEATDVRVDWSYWPLLARRFDATAVSGGQIRLVRRPELEPPSEPGGPQALSIDIDRFSANVELLEGFSKEYGRWTFSGDAAIPRKGVKSANVNAYSLNRKGDYLRLAAAFGDKPEDL